MNYRHIYHAGNFADVVKHITLISLLNKLKTKDKPFAVLDAFAGLGIYDLSTDQAKKTNESESGINKLYNNLTNDTPELIKQYIKIVQECNNAATPTKPLQEIYNPVAIQKIIDYSTESCLYACDDATQKNAIIYPGSPLIISSLLRSYDRLIACELHKEDYPWLKRNMHLYPNSSIHNIDAYQALKAFWPPKEKRGLVLLDPAFEVRDEFNKIVLALKLLKERFSTGMIMVWYPIKDQQNVHSFYHKQKEIGYKETLFIEFEILSRDDLGMNKCGLMICNPPFVAQEITDAMEYLTRVTYQGKAVVKIWIEV